MTIFALVIILNAIVERGRVSVICLFSPFFPRKFVIYI